MNHRAIAAIRLWAFRARAELEAAARFDHIATELEGVGASEAVIEMARDAADDERRHHRLCTELVRHFGGVPQRPRELAVSALACGQTDRRSRVLYEVVAMSCVTETLSTALLVVMREAASDVEVRRVVHEILIDEVRHARLGWAHLAFEADRGDTAFLASRIPAILRATVRDELFETDPAQPDTATAGLGGLDRPSRRAIFQATMRDVVFPGLERFGVDARFGRDWLFARERGNSAARDTGASARVA